MKHQIPFAALALGILAFTFASQAAPGRSSRQGQAVANSRLPFVENAGQVDADGVRFTARTMAGTVRVTDKGELVYAMPAGQGGALAVVRESVVGESQASVRGGARSKALASFFFGREPSGWRSNVPAYDSVEIEPPCSGIRLEVRASGKSVEKIITLAPGIEPSEIALEVAGADSLRVDSSGRLVVRTAIGELEFSAPKAYQEGPCGREAVAVQYWTEGNHYGFETGDYDLSRPLMIDPLLGGTFLGGYQWDDALALAVDRDGRVYAAGFTHSADFPVTPGVYQSALKGTDAFVSIFDNRLTNLVASTFLGGTEVQSAYAIAIDALGRVCIAGDTSSADFPTTPGAYQREHQPGSTNDVFVTILDGSLTTLIASTFLGGIEHEEAHSIAFNDSGDIYVAGLTKSTNFPVTAGAFQRNLKGWGDGFISKFDSNLENLKASTLLGGSNYDRIYSIDLDVAGDVYATGETGGNGFPTTNLPYNASFNGGEHDAFVSKLGGGLSNLLYSTYLGGAASECGYSLVQSASRIYVAGNTFSSNFPTTATAYQKAFGGGTNDAFICAFDVALNQLVESTFLGGSDFDSIEAMELHPGGSVYVAGYTFSSNFPTTPGAYCRTNMNSDAFLSVFDGQLTTLGASTLVGGSLDDYAFALALDLAGNVFAAGYTESYDFPTSPGAFERFYHVPTLPWHGDAFVIKMDPELSDRPAPPISVSASDKTYADRIAVSWTASDKATGYTVWRSTSSSSGSAAMITSAAETAFADWDVLPGAQYYYWVKAVNSSGASDFSDPATGARSPVFPLAADFDGDGLADPAVVTNGYWHVWMSRANYIHVGPALGADASWLSAAGDFDGDRLADPVAAEVDGRRYCWLSGANYYRIGPVAFGSGRTSALAADFDGDRLGDMAAVDGRTWHLWLSSANYQAAIPLTYGEADAIPVAADFDGDLYADFARFQAGAWQLWLSGSYYAPLGPLVHGQAGDLPVAADFDGDARADMAVYRVSAGQWFVWLSSANYFMVGPFPFHP